MNTFVCDCCKQIIKNKEKRQQAVQFKACINYNPKINSNRITDNFRDHVFIEFDDLCIECLSHMIISIKNFIVEKTKTS